MLDSTYYLIIIIIGAGLGVLVRKKRGNTGPLSFISLMETAAICALVFVMSARLGSNEEVANNLGTIGIYGILTTLVIFGVTILLAFLVRRLLGFDAAGRSIRKTAQKAASGEDISDGTDNEKKDDQSIDRTAIFITVFVALGLLSGRLIVSRIFSDYSQFNDLASLLIRIALTVLLLFVGFDMGYDDSGGGDLRNTGLKVLFFPAVTVLGAILGGVIMYFIMPVTLRESLAIASGFGWYSLGPVIIMDAGHLTASAISFVHNLTRELFSMLIVPFVARYVGFIEAACVPGSPAMDICLPVVERSTNSTVVIYSFITGFIVSGFVPILVPLFIGS